MTRKEEIDYIKSHIRILDLARTAGIQLKPCGRNRYKCLSLIHLTETKPSLVIYDDQNSFYDYSAQEGGSVIDFYQLLYSCDYVTAVRDLRSMAGLNTSKLPLKKPQDVLRAREAFNSILTLCFLLPPRERSERLKKLANLLEAFQDDLQGHLLKMP